MAHTILLNGSLASSLINFRGSLIAELVKRGYQVHVTAPEISATIADELRQLGAIPHSIYLVRDGISPLGDLAYVWAIFSLIRRHRIDTVIGYTIKPNIFGTLAAKLAGVRSAAMITGLGFSFVSGTGLGRRMIQRTIRRLYRLATDCNYVVIFQNPDDQKDFVKAGFLADSGKARLVDGSGVDVAYYAASSLPESATFLMISRFLWSKGIREYAAAAQQLRALRPGIRTLLVGFGGGHPDTVSEAELTDWADGGLEFLGELKDVRPALLQASVYVLPSYREGTPRSVLEAMAMARAIITTDAPGCRETVSDGINGLLVPVGNVPALVEAMLHLADDPVKRANMGRESRRIAESRYCVEHVNARLLEHLGL